MPAESAYREACAAACAWCAKGLPLNTVGGLSAQITFHGPGMQRRCTAPTLAVFAQSQALGRVAAEKRAEEAEKEQSRLRIGYANLIRLHDIEKTDMSEQLRELSEERDRLRAVLRLAYPFVPNKSRGLVVRQIREALAPAPATVAEESGNL